MKTTCRWKGLFAGILLGVMQGLGATVTDGTAYEAVPGAAPSSPTQTAPSPSYGLQQFTSGGHVLGFHPGGFYMAAMSHALRVDFVGARAVTPLAEGNAARSGAGKPPELKRIYYPQLWPGIDLEYTSGGGIAESTYTLSPGARVSDIALEYNVPYRIGDDGALTLRFQTGELTESAPIAWQVIEGERVAVEVAFVRKEGENRLGFEVGEYEVGRELFIDPVYNWHSFFNTTSPRTSSMAVDAVGNIYVAGDSTSSWNGPNGEAPINGYAGGEFNIYVIKLNASGTYQWHTFYGSSNAGRRELAYSIITDVSGHIYVAGSSESPWNGPSGEPPINPYSGRDWGGWEDILVLKLDTNGIYQWHTFHGSSEPDSAKSIALDTAGNVYLTGESSMSWNGPSGQGPINPYNEGDFLNIAVLKLDAGGAYQWHTFHIGGDASAIVKDSGDNLYISGYSSSSWKGPAGQAPLHAYSGSSSEIVVIKLDIIGTYQWHTFYGSNGSDSAESMVMDVSGNIYVTGSSALTWSGPTGQIPIHAHSGGSDIMVLKLAPSGTYLWHTFYGSSESDVARDISTDTNGNLYVVGQSSSTWSGPAAQSPINPHAEGSGNYNDLMILKLNNNGFYQWHGFYGSTEQDSGLGIDTYANGSVYVLGTSRDTWNGPNGQLPLNAHSGYSDIIILSLPQNPAIAPTYAIITAANPVAGGTVTCDPNPVSHGDNSSCTVTPNPGYSFVDWEGDCTGAACNLTNVTSAKSVTANFSLGSYPITTAANPIAGGTVTCDPNPVTHGSDSSCTATPNPGYSFVDWEGDCTGAACNLTNVTSPKSVTANFNNATIVPTVTLDAIDLQNTYPPLQPNDTVTLHWSTTNANSTDNMVLSIKRASAAGLAAPDGVNWYHFTDAPAYGGATANDGSETVTIPSGLAEADDWRFYVRHVASDVYDASSDLYTYAVPLQTYPLTVTKSGTGSGTVTSSPGGIDCGSDCSENFPQTDPQTVVRLTAQADTGSVFIGWSGGGCSGTDPCNVTMDAEKTVSANFSLGAHTITTAAEPEEGGTATCAPNPVDHNETSNCTARSNEGYNFTGWSGDCTGMNCQLTNVTSAKNVTANFDVRTYAITATADPEVGGTVRCTPSRVNPGDDSNCFAQANNGYSFTGWSGDCTGMICNLDDVTSDKNVTANFDNSTTDTDGDGLPDVWERYGVTLNGVEMELHQMGADPNVKDIFVEVDYMEECPPDKKALIDVVEAFRKAGINLHIDAGPTYSPEPWIGVSGSNIMPYTKETIFNIWFNELITLGNPHLSLARRPIFHHVGMVNQVVAPFQYGRNVNGAAATPAESQEHLPDLILSQCKLSSWWGGSTFKRAVGLMHELGHTLGLSHGGQPDEPNYKPNYMSVMNYLYADYKGIRRDGKDYVLDYSRFAAEELDEDNLFEADGIGGVPDEYKGYGVRYFCPEEENVEIDDSLKEVDWNCSKDIDTNALSLNLTGCKVDKLTEDCVPALEELNGYNDWSNLDFNFTGVIGNAAASSKQKALVARQSLPRIVSSSLQLFRTPDEFRTPEVFAELERLSPYEYGGLLSGNRFVSAMANTSVIYTLVLENNGTEPNTYTMEFLESPSGLGVGTLSGPITLPGRTTQTISLQLDFPSAPLDGGLIRFNLVGNGNVSDSLQVLAYTITSQKGGDIDGDGDIDNDDLALLEQSLGEPAHGIGDPLDLDNSGYVDANDIALLLANCPGCRGTSSAVPALSRLSLLLLFCILLIVGMVSVWRYRTRSG